MAAMVRFVNDTRRSDVILTLRPVGETQSVRRRSVPDRKQQHLLSRKTPSGFSLVAGRGAAWARLIEIGGVDCAQLRRASVA